MPHQDPFRIFSVGLGFMQSKVLLAAVELELFTVLAEDSRTASELEVELGLHPRATRDFLDTLVSIGFLEREGDGESARYSNPDDCNRYLDKAKPGYLGGMLEMANNRLYRFWGNLEAALRTGEPQNELTHGRNLFEELYEDEEQLEAFLAAMASFQMDNFVALAETFEFSDFDSMCDVGGANGALAIEVARRHPKLECASFDLPPVRSVASRNIEAAELTDRIELLSGDFFTGELPNADVLTMGNVLHDWNEAEKVALLTKAFEALPSGGALVAVENVIDDERRSNMVGLLTSLSMLLETPGGFDYTFEQFEGWAAEAGFGRSELRPLAGASSAAIAWKA